MIMMRALRLLCLGVLALLPPPDAYCAETAPATPDPVSASPLQSNGTDHRDARERLKRPSSGASGGGLFETKIWTPPVVEQPRMAAPKPVPVAPRFPYEYMGRMQSAGQPDTVYLTKDSNVYAVSVGDAIEGTYRVLDVSGERLEVMYLPLGTKQQIPFQSIVAAVQPQGMTNTYVNPGLPQSVNTPVPAQFNLAPMFDTARPGEAPQAPVPGSTPRGGNQPTANAAAPTGQQAPAPTANAAAQSPGGVAPTMVVPTLIPTPVVVSPPSVSGFAAPAPANQNANTTGTAPAPNTGAPAVVPGAPGSAPPTETGSVPGGVQINETNPSGATSAGNAGAQVGVPYVPAPPGR